ncbi:MAG: hypothetical protein OXD44_08255 [Gammaproteobacteria bacterium]|nr:hypothetical protein [Gammaproteobacteria bacterium]MCY4226835.1 hypothetical protein [Gammaproteobacteria bacterium]MCY4313666.1 hypothetical protein [Gammaproteobacteria bacterium]
MKDKEIERLEAGKLMERKIIAVLTSHLTTSLVGEDKISGQAGAELIDSMMDVALAVIRHEIKGAVKDALIEMAEEQALHFHLSSEDTKH